MTNSWHIRLRQRWPGALAGSLMAGLLGLFLFFTSVGERVAFLSYDIPFAFRDPVIPTNALIVYLDDESHTALGQRKNRPWDRVLHAELLQKLKAAGAQTVVFDVLFGDPWEPCEYDRGKGETDQIFARAIRTHGGVILGGVSTNREELVPVLREAAAGWGLVNYYKELFGPRQHLAEVDGLPGLPWAAARAVNAPVTRTSTPGAVTRWINYYGRPGSLPSASYAHIFTNQFSPDMFRDRVVFIGARQSVGLIGAGKDEFPTAFTWLSRTHSPGAEIHATVFLNLLRQDWLTRWPRGLEVLLILLAGFGAGFGLPLLHSRPAAWVSAASIALVLLGAWLLFRLQLVWFAWLIVVLQLFVALFWSAIYNSFRSYVERAVLERSLALHLPVARVRQILKSPHLLAPSAEKQEVSLMFTDIADWSTISERLSPDKLFKLLNRYFQETIPCVHAQQGMVLQLVGDAIFAVWNAPEPQPNHQELACRAALALRDQLVQFEGANQSYPLRTRVGLHCGLASVGNCGSADRLVYTALGAETNMASRLEGLNKQLGTQILASDRVAEAVEDKFDWRSLGRFRLKGGDRVLEIYELLGGPAGGAETAEWRQHFQRGLRHFQHAEWEAAVENFCHAINARGDDGPSRFYLRRIEKLRLERPSEKWFGEINLDEK